MSLSADGGRLALGSFRRLSIVGLEDGSIRRIQTPGAGRVLGWLDDDVVVLTAASPRPVAPITQERVPNETSTLYGISISRGELMWQLTDVPCRLRNIGPLNSRGTFSCVRPEDQYDIWLAEDFDPWIQ